MVPSIAGIRRFVNQLIPEQGQRIPDRTHAVVATALATMFNIDPRSAIVLGLAYLTFVRVWDQNLPANIPVLAPAAPAAPAVEPQRLIDDGDPLPQDVLEQILRDDRAGPSDVFREEKKGRQSPVAALRSMEAPAGEEDPISGDGTLIDPEYRLQLSDRAYDMRTFIKALFIGPSIRNPYHNGPLTSDDLAAICNFFGVTPAEFQRFWAETERTVSADLDRLLEQELEHDPLLRLLRGGVGVDVGLDEQARLFTQELRRVGEITSANGEKKKDLIWITRREQFCELVLRGSRSESMKALFERN